ncbi:hypothetical protein CEXT_594221 [Caerostris extrusa]|uniref:Uncharacterized protein n=1 Tax=Caerostris extrusa TaxID=172846 RepID=A0AAV4SZC0_CAEEX|nr:hypothetical protein CEXT_594221 [Caerostris extrusa]
MVGLTRTTNHYNPSYIYEGDIFGVINVRINISLSGYTNLYIVPRPIVTAVILSDIPTGRLHTDAFSELHPSIEMTFFIQSLHICS